jgi:hypothetical protein
VEVQNKGNCFLTIINLRYIEPVIALCTVVHDTSLYRLPQCGLIDQQIYQSGEKQFISHEYECTAVNGFDVF